MSEYKDWIGKTQATNDVASRAPLEGLAAMLDRDMSFWREGELPPLAHWLYFLRPAKESEIGPDGHPRRGGFLPPITLPRRMWAGSRVEFLNPIPVGAEITDRSEVANIVEKQGNSGAMIFVTVRREIVCNAVLAIREERDVVYRDESKAASASAAPQPDTRKAEWSRAVTPDPVLLFRFSALTFNAHRIHYDRDYAMKTEGYPGLVVQGPLTAMLLMDHYLAKHPHADIARFEFRAERPLFGGAPFQLCGDGTDLWARTPSGERAMSAKIAGR
jgi:3-methylfumaryl-CoA hydratase